MPITSSPSASNSSTSTSQPAKSSCSVGPVGTDASIAMLLAMGLAMLARWARH